MIFLKNLYSKKLIKFSLWSAVFTALVGTLLHFAFKWTNGSLFAAPFAAVNESTFEHLKLIFWPFLITTIIGLFVFPDKKPSFIASAAVSVFSGMVSIIVLFYTYSGIIGRFYSAVNIIIFFVSVAFSYYLLYLFMKNKSFDFPFSGVLGSLIFILLIAVLISFTFLPPKIALFLDPLTKSYGLPI